MMTDNMEKKQGGLSKLKIKMEHQKSLGEYNNIWKTASGEDFQKNFYQHFS